MWSKLNVAFGLNITVEANWPSFLKKFKCLFKLEIK